MKQVTNKRRKFAHSLLAMMGVYFAVSSLLPASFAVAVIIVLLTGSFL